MCISLSVLGRTTSSSPLLWNAQAPRQLASVSSPSFRTTRFRFLQPANVLSPTSLRLGGVRISSSPLLRKHFSPSVCRLLRSKNATLFRPLQSQNARPSMIWTPLGTVIFSSPLQQKAPSSMVRSLLPAWKVIYLKLQQLPNAYDPISTTLTGIVTISILLSQNQYRPILSMPFGMVTSRSSLRSQTRAAPNMVSGGGPTCTVPESPI